MRANENANPDQEGRVRNGQNLFTILFCIVAILVASKIPDDPDVSSDEGSGSSSRIETSNPRMGSWYDWIGWHHIEEGSVGLYWRLGALQDRQELPGFHWMLPCGIDTVHTVPITMQTQLVRDIPCGTSGGVLLNFENIEVVYQLGQSFVWGTVKNYSIDFHRTWIEDLVPSLMNGICTPLTLHEVFISKFSEIDEQLRDRLRKVHANWAPGIQVIAVRIVKPSIPESIRSNFEQADRKTSELKTLDEKQAVVLRAAEKDRALATLAAQKDLEISKLQSESNMLHVKRQVSISNVSVNTATARIREQSDAEHYAKMKEAEVNKYRLSPTFLELQRRLHLVKNTDIYWGGSVPSAIIERGNYDENPATSTNKGMGDDDEQLLGATLVSSQTVGPEAEEV